MTNPKVVNVHSKVARGDHLKMTHPGGAKPAGERPPSSKLVCGPSSRNLAAYGRWHAARNNADRSYLDALRLLLASAPRANTTF